MEKFIISSRPISSAARQTESRIVGRFNCTAVFKGALLTAVFLSGIVVAQAQQPDALTVTPQGNVGIGTSAPLIKLSVVGNVDVSGNVGIGTLRPTRTLDVNGVVGLRRHLDQRGQLLFGAPEDFTEPWMAFPTFFDDTLYFRPEGTSSWSFFSSRGGTVLTMTRDSNVGIGTANPTKAKLEVSGSVNQVMLKYGWLNQNGKTGKFDEPLTLDPTTLEPTTMPYSIWAERRVAAEEFNAFSDERLKNIQGRSDSVMDLRTLLGIEITDYRHKDVIAKGNGTYKKVTGQQVAKVFPQAVSKHTEVVPDIYQPAPIQDGWVALATDLKRGERVKLITAKGEGIYEVLEVAQDRFRIDVKPEGNRVFVYGREVKDFLTVDYEAISMLNVSATQQIKKEKDEEVKALQEENAALRSQLAQQEKRLAAIEAMLLSGNNSATRASSLKKVE